MTLVLSEFLGQKNAFILLIVYVKILESFSFFVWLHINICGLFYTESMHKEEQ